MKRITRIFRNDATVNQFAQWLRDHFATNKFPLRVTIERHVPARSINQNSTMHMWFAEIAEATGDSPASVKADLKAMLLPEVEGRLGVIRPKDTHELSTTECMDFMSRIQSMAAEMGISLTEPMR